MSDLIVSTIRTAVPAGVGFALTWLAINFGLVLSDASSAKVTAATVAVATVGYYAVARKLEQRWPWTGKILLGSAKQPTYQPTHRAG